MLNGFLSPKGKYIECESYEHMDMALEIVEEEYPDNYFKGGFAAELFIMDQGYVRMTARGADFNHFVDKKPRLLTSAQKEFLENNLENANNDDQKEEIEKILRMNQDLSEQSILSFF